jgi:hypothetical protein
MVLIDGVAAAIDELKTAAAGGTGVEPVFDGHAEKQVLVSRPV